MNAARREHICYRRDGTLRTNDDDRPIKPDVVTCGNCYRSWCDRCDPAHGPLCPWCHGRGYSTAPIVTQQNWDRAAKHASLGVGHIWTDVHCPAYLSLDPRDCTCVARYENGRK